MFHNPNYETDPVPLFMPGILLFNGSSLALPKPMLKKLALIIDQSKQPVLMSIFDQN